MTVGKETEFLLPLCFYFRAKTKEQKERERELPRKNLGCRRTITCKRRKGPMVLRSNNNKLGHQPFCCIFLHFYDVPNMPQPPPAMREFSVFPVLFSHPRLRNHFESFQIASTELRKIRQVDVYIVAVPLVLVQLQKGVEKSDRNGQSQSKDDVRKANERIKRWQKHNFQPIFLHSSIPLSLIILISHSTNPTDCLFLSGFYIYFYFTRESVKLGCLVWLTCFFSGLIFPLF